MDQNDIDLYLSDPDFNDDFISRMAYHMKQGATAEGAAAFVGVKKTKFTYWYRNNSVFRDWCDSMESKYCSKIRKEIYNTAKQIKDPKQKADVLINLLTHKDKQFGAKVDHLIIDDKNQTILPGQKTEVEELIEKYEIVDAAEEISNE